MDPDRVGTFVTMCDSAKPRRLFPIYMDPDRVGTSICHENPTV